MGSGPKWGEVLRRKLFRGNNVFRIQEVYTSVDAEKVDDEPRPHIARVETRVKDDTGRLQVDMMVSVRFL